MFLIILSTLNIHTVHEIKRKKFKTDIIKVCNIIYKIGSQLELNMSIYSIVVVRRKKMRLNSAYVISMYNVHLHLVEYK